MSRDDFPIFPMVGDYIKFKGSFAHNGQTNIHAGEIGLVIETKMEPAGENKPWISWNVRVGMKDGRIHYVSYTDSTHGMEVIKVDSPAYKVLYGKSED